MLGIIDGLDARLPLTKGRRARHTGTATFVLIVALLALAGWALFVSYRISFYWGAVWIRALSYETARRRLLALHTLLLWMCLPFYCFSVNNRRMVWSFLRINLWFLPWPPLLKTQTFGGGSSGGAGASRVL